MSSDNRDFQLALQAVIEMHLRRIEQRLGPDYVLTLVCRYKPNDGKDADVVLTLDDWDLAIATIQKMRSRPETDTKRPPQASSGNAFRDAMLKNRGISTNS